MWRKILATGTPSTLFPLLAVLILVGISQSSVSGVAAADFPSYDYNQANSILRDALRQYEKAKTADKISGQVNQRSSRSELGDAVNALKLIQLQELERMYGSKSRPRFGKRGGEITFDNVPTYGESFHPGLDILRRR